MHKLILAASVATLALMPTASANSPTTPADIPVKIFAQLPYMEGAQLSPLGTHIAYLRSHSGRAHLAIEDLRPNGKIVIVPPLEHSEYRWLRWANDERLVYAVTLTNKRSSNEVVETRLLSVKADGGDARSIMRSGKQTPVGSHVGKQLPQPYVQDDVISWLPGEPDHILVTVDEDRDDEFEVRRINVNNGRYRIMQSGLAGMQHWLVDQDGKVRLGWGFFGNDFMVRFVNTDGDWEARSNAAWVADGYEPVAFTQDPNTVFAIGPDASGRNCIRKVDLVTGEYVATVFEHESIDADGLVFDSATGWPVGVSYTVDLPRHKYFDDQLAKLKGSIDKAAPNSSNQIAGLSSDRRHVLVYSVSATEPAAYYHWNRDAKSFSFVGEAMPNLPAALLSSTEPVSYTARDGLEIPGYLTLPAGKDARNLPAIVIPHAGPHERADQSFKYLTQFLASRGYAVLLPNFRGSSGYGADFSEAGKSEWGGKMQDDITDGATWLVEQGIADADRICIVGWSYGGYAAAMGAVKTPNTYQCAVSINGILDLAGFVAGDRDYLGGFEWTEHIGLKSGSAKLVSPYHQAEKIGIPMLIVQAQDDPRVLPSQAKTMAERLDDLGKDVTYIEVDSGGHDVNYEPARLKVLSELEQFLKQNIGS